MSPVHPDADLALPRKFLRMCRLAMRREKVADSSGMRMTGGELLLRTLVVRRVLRRILGRDERFVGLLLPPSAPAVLANAALAIDQRVSVNLNYTVSPDVMNDCVAQCGLRHVITSRRVMERLQEKFPLNIQAELVYLEDFKDKITLADKAIAALQAWAMPVGWLERHLGLDRIKPEDLLTVIFTSGATGRPKGVMLSHRNINANIAAVDAIIRLTPQDVVLGVLPMFHSFGYTCTMWVVLALEPQGVYHYSPLDAREIGKLCRRHGATIMIATPTFLRGYLRRCEREDFAKLDVVVVGAEKMPIDVAEAFERQFGVRPVEGYGATELSPVVSLNTPATRATTERNRGVKEGTVGQPLPNVKVKAVDLNTGADLGIEEQGMLLVSGPSVMEGYLNRPDLTAEVLRDGWYVTGDVGMIDADGFIRITGRLARFSKIGGEMVPHIRVEEAIVAALALPEDELRVVVTAVPDAKKGERLVVLHTGLPQPPEAICRALAQAGLPPIWVPSADCFRQIAEIPVLGTGKLNIARAKELAAELFQTAAR